MSALELPDDFGSKLRDWRERNSLTQRRLADILEVTPQTVGKWERGEAVQKRFRAKLVALLKTETEETGTVVPLRGDATGSHPRSILDQLSFALVARLGAGPPLTPSDMEAVRWIEKGYRQST